MMAGGLTEVIDIYKPVSTTNTFGERESDYQKQSTTRAEVVINSGSRNRENNEIVFGHSITFRVRKYVVVDDFCRIKYNGKFYRITNIELLKKSQMIEIQTEKVNE